MSSSISVHFIYTVGSKDRNIQKSVTPEATDSIVTCPPQFPQEIDSIPWDEVGHKTRYKRIENVEGIEFGN
jgi:hypothetical protein